jgi:hypothetical protein
VPIWAVLLPCSLVIQCSALAVGPTSVNPVAWAQVGVGLSFDPSHPNRVLGWAGRSTAVFMLSTTIPIALAMRNPMIGS